MRVVIDSNRVQSDELSCFLASSKSNRAVVTDWLMMEAYKGETLKSIYKSLGVLAQYPNQVIVVKNTGMCMETRVGPQMSKRLIWNEITDNFASFIDEVQSAKTGNLLIEDSLLWRGQKANERMIQLLDEMDSILDRYRMMLEALTEQDIHAIRGRGMAAPGMIERITVIASSIAEGYRQSLGIKSWGSTNNDVTNDFLFRVGVGITSSFLEWVRTGSQKSVNTTKLRNDRVDAMLSVYGTYFNGLMTVDSKLSVIHSLHRHLLKKMGASMPPAYAESR